MSNSDDGKGDRIRLYDRARRPSTVGDHYGRASQAGCAETTVVAVPSEEYTRAWHRYFATTPGTRAARRALAELRLLKSAAITAAKGGAK